MARVVLACFFLLLSFANAEVRTVNGLQYFVTSLDASGTSDPNALADQYGHSDDWTSIILVRNGQNLKMTDALSETIDNSETLLIPNSWVNGGSSDTPPPPPPPPPPPTKTPRTPPPPPPRPPPPPPSGSSGPWLKSVATYYESYPTTEEEATADNGDAYKGIFAAFNDVKPESWVKANNIVAVGTQAAFNQLKLKHILISQSPDGSNPLSVQVVDYCSDSDCGGCCTANMQSGGANFLIDLEKYTAARFLGKTPEQVVKDSVFTTIYYSVPSGGAANADGVSTYSESSPVPNNVIIGLSVGAAVLVVVVVVIIIVVVTNKRKTEEKV